MDIKWLVMLYLHDWLMQSLFRLGKLCINKFSNVNL